MNGSPRGRRLFVRVAVILALTLSGLLATTGPANARAYVCSQSHGAVGNRTCLDVYGSGLRVTYVWIDHSHTNLSASYCQYMAKFWGTMPAGGTWTKQSNKTTGCVIALASVRFDVNRDFKNNTKVYGQLYHDGSWAPGSPAATIKK